MSGSFPLPLRRKAKLSEPAILLPMAGLVPGLKLTTLLGCFFPAENPTKVGTLTPVKSRTFFARYGQAGVSKSGIQRLLVFFRATILGELNHKEDYCGYQ